MYCCNVKMYFCNVKTYCCNVKMCCCNVKNQVLEGSQQHDQECLGNIYDFRSASGAAAYGKVKLAQTINKYAV
jgi:hypothetical protein